MVFYTWVYLTDCFKCTMLVPPLESSVTDSLRDTLTRPGLVKRNVDSSQKIWAAQLWVSILFLTDSLPPPGLQWFPFRTANDHLNDNKQHSLVCPLSKANKSHLLQILSLPSVLVHLGRPVHPLIGAKREIPCKANKKWAIWMWFPLIVGMIEYLQNILGALVVQWHLGVLAHPYGPRNRRDSINSSILSHVT